MSQINVDQIYPYTGNAVEIGNVAIKSINNSVTLGMFNNLTTIGSFSSGVGVNTLQNSTGLGNSALGYNALKTVTTGASNTAVGVEALRDTTASRNTAVGYNSGTQITTGADNLTLGYGAGNTITTGSANTFIGSNTFGLATGSFNIVVGYQAATSSTTVSNEITLGSYGITALRCAVTSITSLSDARDKKDVSPIELGLDFVKELNPVKFVWDDRSELGKHDIADSGFIAQDLKALEDKYDAADVLKLVYDENPEKLEASYGRLIPVLVQAIKDLAAKVEVLESK